LNEEPDVGKLLVRFCEGLRHNWCMAEILWHRRETRRQTENTNIMPIALEGLSLLDKNSSRLAVFKTREFFNPVEFVEGISDRLRCDRFVIEDFAIDRIHRIYRLNRIGKTLEFS